MIAVDTSALVAIMRGEAEAGVFTQIIAKANRCVLSAVSLLETSIVLAGIQGTYLVWGPCGEFVARAGIAIVPFDEVQAELARAAFLKFGKGRHAAALNFGDCASYALAKSKGVPLLFKGRDFALTDVLCTI